MPLEIDTRFTFNLPRPSDALLQFGAADIPEQIVEELAFSLSETEHCARIPAQDAIGERLWIRAGGQCSVEYRARVTIQRQVLALDPLAAVAPHDMPGEAVSYLFDSRYCPADRLQSFVEAEFGGTTGGARAAAIREWTAAKIAYRPGTSTARTTALDTIVERQGVCRDFAHVVIALARASTIPARYVACYAPGVDPPDFHAVAEVFLADPETPGGGTWQVVDATGMAEPGQTAKIGVGRDAADVSFLTSFGVSELLDKSVAVRPC